MRLPLIKGFLDIAEAHGETALQDTIKVLEATAEVRGFKEEELEVIGELLSNIFGALEVNKDVGLGTPRAEALNAFMTRVLGSIDKK